MRFTVWSSHKGQIQLQTGINGGGNVSGYAQPALVEAEFARRQTDILRKAAEAQKLAADAMIMSANAAIDTSDFVRTQTELLRQSGEDQKRAADATVETAEATKRTAHATRENAKYMLWSVIVLAVASVLNVAVTLMEHPK